MRFTDAVSGIFSSKICWMIMGVVTALGILRGLWRGLFKKKKSGADYWITLVIYLCTDGFISILLGFLLCLLLQYLPSLLGIDAGFLGKLSEF